MSYRDDQPPLDLATRVALTLPEAAAALGISERHLRNHLHAIPHFHLGNKPLIPVDSLREWARREVEVQDGRAEREADALMRSLS
jgi:hypothetical protein